jgi:hypothetical protein
MINHRGFGDPPFDYTGHMVYLQSGADKKFTPFLVIRQRPHPNSIRIHLGLNIDQEQGQGKETRTIVFALGT